MDRRLVPSTLARDRDSTLGVHTPNLGVQMFWGMVPASTNRWQGWDFVPLCKKKLRGEIAMQTRRRISVGGCIGPVCKSQDWSRVRKSPVRAYFSLCFFFISLATSAAISVE